MAKAERFSSRWGLLLASIGMAIGAGNIWRFPRLVAQNGGSAFLIPWLIFLFLWSIPLLVAEFAIGKYTRKGTIGSFAEILGKRFAWMGAFVGFCTMGIMFYYSVVTGWSLYYFFQAVGGHLLRIADHEGFWANFAASPWPLAFHALAISTAGYVIYRGIAGGVERVSKVFVPALFVLMIIAAIRAVTLPHAATGLNYLFFPNLSKLVDYRVWLEALSQSAWSTGAGWGLVLTYAVYMREREDIGLNAFLTGFGNNSASLIAALAIIPTIFSLLTHAEALQAVRAGNTGLTFIWIPRLFEHMPLGRFFASVFFLAFFIAALSSLIAMVELAVRIFIDFGMRRRRAVFWVWGGTLLLGVPSALSLDFFNNQDWAWGLGLMVSGFFFALAVNRFGPERFRTRLVNTVPGDLKLGRWFNFLFRFVIPAEFVVMLGWWFFQAITVYEPQSWWNPFRTYSLGTCILQWGVVLVLFWALNDTLVRKMEAAAHEG